MATKLMSDILQAGVNAGQVPAKTQQARDWFRAQAGQVTASKVGEGKFIRQADSKRMETTFKMGHMYTFSYDPKHKKTLPYYDRYPLIFPINKAKGGFLGINMHYLSPPMRARLMDQLYTVTTNETYNENTKLRISYDILESASKFRFFKPTVKHYLNSQVRSKLVYIHPTEWDIALFLPTAKFVGANKRKVYLDSRSKIVGR